MQEQGKHISTKNPSSKPSKPSTAKPRLYMINFEKNNKLKASGSSTFLNSQTINGKARQREPRSQTTEGLSEAKAPPVNSKAPEPPD